MPTTKGSSAAAAKASTSPMKKKTESNKPPMKGKGVSKAPAEKRPERSNPSSPSSSQPAVVPTAMRQDCKRYPAAGKKRFEKAQYHATLAAEYDVEAIQHMVNAKRASNEAMSEVPILSYEVPLSNTFHQNGSLPQLI